MLSKEQQLNDYLKGITAIDTTATEQAKERLDMLAKPPGSLGRLEELAAQLAGITGNIKNKFDKKCVIIMSSDNGVVEEGVASAPPVVTLVQTINFTKGITGISVLARKSGADLIIVDVGINADIEHPQIINRKIRKGTYNIAKQAAMSREEAVCAILTGIEMVKNAVEEGYKLIGVGEMGIGNTTTSSAVLSAITQCEISKAVGKGAGLIEESYNKKIQVIERAILINKPDRNDPIDVVSKLGGFDIAAMTGIYIGAAFYKIPVVSDGFISCVAAMLALKLNPQIQSYIIASHASKEPGNELVLQETGLKPLLDFGMRLGEGSGCPLAFDIIDSACAVINEMATFAEASIDEEYLSKVLGKDAFN